MNLQAEELRNSWAHCKELLTTRKNNELATAFLEDFKERFTIFYKKVNAQQQIQIKEVSKQLVDSVSLFWQKKGKLSHIISLMKRRSRVSHERFQSKVKEVDTQLAIVFSHIS